MAMMRQMQKRAEEAEMRMEAALEPISPLSEIQTSTESRLKYFEEENLTRMGQFRLAMEEKIDKDNRRRRHQGINSGCPKG